MKSLKTNKTPGIDNFTEEFYKLFLPNLIEPLTNLFHFSLGTGVLPASGKQSITVVIPKQDTDKLTSKAFHPIVLLNVDSKFFTTVLASRLNIFISKYIHLD